MNNKDRHRLQTIAEVGEKLLQTISEEGITKDLLLQNYRTQWLVTTPLYNIGEQANCVSKEITEAHPELPWAGVAGLRHRLVHDYQGTNWELVSAVLFEELRPFIEGVQALVQENREEGL